MPLSKTESDLLIHLAREAIAAKVGNGDTITVTDKLEIMDTHPGVFVTIRKNGLLRGCIGYPEAPWPLRQTLVMSAIAAAQEDPRFPPLRPGEIKNINVEVSLLTPPAEIKVRSVSDLSVIKIGTDGLVVEHGFRRGLLLPQVATEENLSPLEFLEATCNKAGLPNDCWRDPSTKIYKFSAEYYSEPDQ